MNQQPSGSGYIQQTAPPQAPSVGVVPQMMNFVPTHPPIPAPPVVQPVPNAQNQYPSFPYPGVQNYNSAVSSILLETFIRCSYLKTLMPLIE